MNREVLDVQAWEGWVATFMERLEAYAEFAAFSFTDLAIVAVGDVHPVRGILLHRVGV